MLRKTTERFAEEDAVPGAVIAIQSFGDFLGFNFPISMRKIGLSPIFP